MSWRASVCWRNNAAVVPRCTTTPLPHLPPPARAVGPCAAALVAQQGHQCHVCAQHEGAGQEDERHPADVAW